MIDIISLYRYEGEGRVESRLRSELELLKARAGMGQELSVEWVPEPGSERCGSPLILIPFFSFSGTSYRIRREGSRSISFSITSFNRFI